MADAEEWDGTMSAFQDDEERRVLFKTIDSFYQYRHQAHYNTTHRRRQNFYALPRAHQEMLLAPPFNMRDRFSAVDAAIDDNAVIAECILRNALENFGFDHDTNSIEHAPWRRSCTADDLAKVSTTINQFYRDWSSEGMVERNAHFQPVLEDLERLFNETKTRNDVKVLVPGAGLGRLVFEICNAGFAAEGNEISFHALLASNWVLNSLHPGEHYQLHPFALKFSNHETVEDQLKAVRIPDIHPGCALQRKPDSDRHKPGEMSMSASDFLTAYKQDSHKDIFDAVVTVFFIDTAPNVIRYIETIRHTLKEGGYWINLGPLLWHFEERKPEDMSQSPAATNKIPGIEEPGSIELAHEDMIKLVQVMGFEIVIMEMSRETPVGYIQQQSSMMQSTYRVSHFVARKLPSAV